MASTFTSALTRWIARDVRYEKLGTYSTYCLNSREKIPNLLQQLSLAFSIHSEHEGRLFNGFFHDKSSPPLLHPPSFTTSYYIAGSHKRAKQMKRVTGARNDVILDNRIYRQHQSSPGSKDPLFSLVCTDSATQPLLANLRSGQILAVLKHPLQELQLKVSPCPPECYLQSETKIEPDLRLVFSRTALALSRL